MKDDAVNIISNISKTKPIDETQVIHRMRQLGLVVLKAESKKQPDKSPVDPGIQSFGSVFIEETSTDYLSWPVLGGSPLIGAGHFVLVHLSKQKARDRKSQKYQNAKIKESMHCMQISYHRYCCLNFGGIYLMLAKPDQVSTTERVQGPQAKNKVRLANKNKRSEVLLILYNTNLQGFGISGQF